MSLLGVCAGEGGLGNHVRFQSNEAEPDFVPAQVASHAANPRQVRFIDVHAEVKRIQVPHKNERLARCRAHVLSRPHFNFENGAIDRRPHFQEPDGDFGLLDLGTRLVGAEVLAGRVA
jgi:hypothetical protein